MYSSTLQMYPILSPKSVILLACIIPLYFVELRFKYFCSCFKHIVHDRVIFFSCLLYNSTHYQFEQFQEKYIVYFPKYLAKNTFRFETKALECTLQ